MNIFQQQYKFYHLKVNLKTALCAIYMFEYFFFKLSVDYYI